MKPLNLRQVRICEQSIGKRCVCRCGGELHGAGLRSKFPEYFEKLPADDPHRVPARSRQLPLPPPLGLEPSYGLRD